MGDRLLYATPTGKHPHPAYIQSARLMEASCRSFERRIEDFLMAAGPVQMARSKIAEQAMRGNCYRRHDHKADAANCKHEPYDFVVMHDDDLAVDVAYGPCTVPHDHGSGLECDRPRVNPLDAWHDIFARNPDVGVIAGVYLREVMETPLVVMSHPDYPEENCHVVAGLPHGPFVTSGVGTGFFMIRVSAMRAMVEADELAEECMFRFSFGQTRWGVTNATGEDYDFCSRMRKAGYRVLADPRFPSVHVKESGLLRYEHGAYEADWGLGPDGKVNEARVRRLRSQLEPLMSLRVIDGVLCIDHTQQLAATAANRAARRAPKKEAA